MSRWVWLILVLVTVATAQLAADATSRDRRCTMSFGGRMRTYYLHLPPGYDGTRKLPMIFLLHGGGGSAIQALKHYPLEEVADRESFILVVPDGTGPVAMEILHTWNVEFGFGYAWENRVDDSGFLRALIVKLEQELAVDPTRVYLTGLSNGAILCHWVAARHSDLIAGIAPVVGCLGGRGVGESQVHLPPRPTHPVDVILFQGELDDHVPLAGGWQRKHAGVKKWLVSAEATAQFWVEANGCQPQPEVEELPAQKALRKTWSGGRGNTRVILYILHNQGHAWPGGRQPRGQADAPSPDLKAHEVMWQFLSRRVKP